MMSDRIGAIDIPQDVTAASHRRSASDETLPVESSRCTSAGMRRGAIVGGDSKCTISAREVLSAPPRYEAQDACQKHRPHHAKLL